MKKVPVVKIEVLGGVAEITKKSRGVRVILEDHDNADGEQIFEANDTVSQ